MELKQVLGSTWVIEAYELIPFYKLDHRHIVLLDNGMTEEEEELDRTLTQAGLIPVGVICSHAHEDHAGNNLFLQKKYGTKIALTAAEAGTCVNLLGVKNSFIPFTTAMTRRFFGALVHTPDLVLPEEDGPFRFCGAEFQIIHTPGHSPDHLCTITPDGVCYTGDALLSRELLGSKLPYNLDHVMAAESREKLRGLPCQAYIMAHRGICSNHMIDSLIDDNQELIRLRARQIWSLIETPMHASEIHLAVCTSFKLLSRRPTRAMGFQRNINLLLEYLLDTGALETECRDGVVYYKQAGEI